MKNINVLAWGCVLLLLLAFTFTSCKQNDETTINDTTVETSADTISVVPDETITPADTMVTMPAE